MRIGRYVLEEYLGGGMASVYRANDSVMNRTVALKLLTPENANNPEAKARFLREAQLGACVEHDHIVRVYDFGETDGHTFLVTEFLRGLDLASAIQLGRTGSVANRLEILHQLSSALSAVHGLGITHRDVKPANVHLDKGGRIRLMDFGIARLTTSELTRTGDTVGSPSYMAPEQVSAGNISHLADIYSFGALAFELFCGEKPHKAETIEAIFYKILNEPADFTLLRAAQCPEGVISLVQCCLAKAPENRPQSANELETELAALLGGINGVKETGIDSGPLPPRHTPIPTGRRFWVAVLSVFLGISITVWVVRHPRPSGHPDRFPPQTLMKEAYRNEPINERKRSGLKARNGQVPVHDGGRQSNTAPYHDKPFTSSPFR
jgi:serine/threonine-protein kinase